mgnify:CR=1 FL=1
MQENSALRVAEKDPKGPLVVVTSAGFDRVSAEEMPCISKFFREVEKVVGF